MGYMSHVEKRTVDLLTKRNGNEEGEKSKLFSQKSQLTMHQE